jgi:hypothetical protein
MASRPFLLTLAAAVALTGAACSRSHSVSTTDGKVTVTEKGKDGAASMTFTGKNGEKVQMDVNSGKVPDDYPADVPVYKDARITLSQTVSDKNGRNLVMETGDAADKIIGFYKAGLESNGWKIEGTVAMGDMSMLTATKAARQFVVQITNSNDKRSIMQTVADKQ